MAANEMPAGFGAWYDAQQGDTGDLWHRTLIDPGLFRRLGPVAVGTRVLDLGCGNGYISRRLARGGAQVTGVDSSAALIERARAREQVEPMGIRFELADAAALPMLDSGSFDVAVANMSLIDIEDAGGAIREVGRLLRKGGRFVATLSHPCFDIDTRSKWIVETKGGSRTVFRAVTAYRQPHSDTFSWDLGESGTVRTVGFHRPLAWYSAALGEAGFVILALDEPAPTEEFQGRTVDREWVDQIPLHLVFEARRE